MNTALKNELIKLRYAAVAVVGLLTVVYAWRNADELGDVIENPSRYKVFNSAVALATPANDWDNPLRYSAGSPRWE
jgi:hypothetical protein